MYQPTCPRCASTTIIEDEPTWTAYSFSFNADGEPDDFDRQDTEHDDSRDSNVLCRSCGFSGAFENFHPAELRELLGAEVVA